MQNVHVKFDFDEALNTKKLLLASELSFLRIHGKINNFKLLRKKESLKKTNFKISLTSLRKKINSMVKELPESKISEIKKPDFTFKEKTKKRKLKQELTDIKKQLERLNQIE